MSALLFNKLTHHVWAKISRWNGEGLSENVNDFEIDWYQQHFILLCSIFPKIQLTKQYIYIDHKSNDILYLSCAQIFFSRFLNSWIFLSCSWLIETISDFVLCITIAWSILVCHQKSSLGNYCLKAWNHVQSFNGTRCWMSDWVLLTKHGTGWEWKRGWRWWLRGILFQLRC